MLVVMVTGESGAAYFRGPDLRAWISHNPVPASAPPLLFDAETQADFPPDAAVAIGQLRDAIEEYLRTGQRPTCVRWQEPDRYLTW